MKNSQLPLRWIPLVLCAATLLYAAPAAAMQLDEQGCIDYAVWSRDLVWAREIGANKELTRASLTKMRDSVKTSPAFAAMFTLLLRDLDGLWETRVDRYLVMQYVARDCLVRGGKYEDAT